MSYIPSEGWNESPPPFPQAPPVQVSEGGAYLEKSALAVLVLVGL